MESSSLLQINISSDKPMDNIIVKEYDENDNILRSYEYYDLTRSIEGNLITKHNDKYGIGVVINSNDHGNMNKNRVLEDSESPAHAHIYSNDSRKLVGLLNITGPCPKTKDDVHEYRASKDSNFNTNIKKIICRWANDSFDKNEYEKNNWKNIQKYWIQKK
jgi:hypothetical protein